MGYIKVDVKNLGMQIEISGVSNKDVMNAVNGIINGVISNNEGEITREEFMVELEKMNKKNELIDDGKLDKLLSKLVNDPDKLNKFIKGLEAKVKAELEETESEELN